VRRLGPGIWSLAPLDTMYNRKAKREKEEKKVDPEVEWSNEGESQGENLHIETN
jgi:hypothetical protein